MNNNNNYRKGVFYNVLRADAMRTNSMLKRKLNAILNRIVMVDYRALVKGDRILQTREIAVLKKTDGDRYCLLEPIKKKPILWFDTTIIENVFYDEKNYPLVKIAPYVFFVRKE